MALALLVWRVGACAGAGTGTQQAQAAPVPVPTAPALEGDGVKIGTFLGDYGRRFYGLGPAPDRLDVLWRVRLGSGWSSGKYDDDPPSEWAGSGWTGQPSLVVDGGRPYVIAGGYDYNLRRIDALTGEVVWKYAFDDIIKSSPAVFANPRPTGEDDRYIVLAGSRRGYPYELADPRVAPYRALTWGSGTELWRLPVPQTKSYSRDCDGSGFYYGGRVYIGVESGWYYALDPFTTEAWRGHRRPRVVAQRLLLGDGRAKPHGGNLVLEASAAAVGGRVYIASGAGHVYGLRRADLSVAWDYFIGSDLDGSPVPTRRGRLLQAVEKQYIEGKGGVLSLDPSKPPGQATEWFFPTGDREVGEWKGGVLGSVAVNDEYDRGGRRPALCAFTGIDGYLYLVSQDTAAAKTVKGPNGEPGLKTPVLVAKVWNGGGISTPIIVGDALVAAGYDQRVHLYKLTYRRAQEGAEGALPSANGDGRFWTVSLRERAQFFAPAAFEATPILWDGRVYIGCRDGWFYCLGDAT
ncbi:MAG: PQQ-binding-like beta-propeller repeat protein [Thermoleophilia bacterium]